MAYLTERKYSFVSTGLDSDTFAVVDFSGEEGLSQCYRFEIMLVADNGEIDLGNVVQNPAKFTIHRAEGDDVDFHGILENFEQLNTVDHYYFYRATLVPKLWWLTLTHHNQIFLDQTVKEIVEAVLEDGGLTALDFEFRLQGEYQKMAYACQYGESHFNFLSRRLEREGIYYFFEQSDAGEKVVFTDTAISHKDSPHGRDMHYSPPSGLGEEHRREIIQDFMCQYHTLPKVIRLKDYNYRKPSLEMTGSAVVDEKGRGEVYYYGEHFRTPEEGNRLAKIRAQELLCRKQEFMGESTVPYVQPGYTFDLQDHYRSSFNQKYLATQMTHEGSQTGYLIAGIMKGLSDREQRVFYRNEFTAIPASTQFRPPRTAEIPKITGTLNAKVDAAGSGQYAELDDQGRYKVILPFDLSGRKDGKASLWLRMIQPYAGSNHGMHFPLHKGTEVLLSFVEGNPDRPIIAGAGPNPETPSQVTSADQTMSKITTSGGNKIHIEDKEGSQRILLQTPTAGTYVRMGAPNDPTEDEKQAHKELHEEEEGYKIHTGSWYVAKIGKGKFEWIFPLEQKMVFGNSFGMVAGAEERVTLGLKLETVVGEFLSFLIAGGLEFSRWIHRLAEEEITVNGQKITGSINRLTINGGNVTLDAKKTKVKADGTEVTGNVTKVKGGYTSVDGDVNHVSGENTIVFGAVGEIIGSDTRVDGQVTNVNGQRTVVTGSVESVAGEHTLVCGDNTTIRAEESRLVGDFENVAGLINRA